jgi:hypothetical protein
MTLSDKCNFALFSLGDSKNDLCAVQKLNFPCHFRFQILHRGKKCMLKEAVNKRFARKIVL